MSDQLITVDELARRLDVHADTVYRQVRLGKIPHYRVGSEIRFDWDEVIGALKGTAA